MTYNISLNEEELAAVIVGLDQEFRDCVEHADIPMYENDGNAVEEFRCAMEVGKLMERFLDLREKGNAK